MKKKILSLVLSLALLVAMLPVPALAEGGGTAESATVTFTATEGTAGAGDNEGCDKLIDGNYTETDGTKWCVTGFNGAYIIFAASERISVKGYSIVTGNDTKENPGRNPKTWTLYGCNDSEAGKDSASWVKIAEVSDDTTLEAENYTKYDFSCSPTTWYQYFKLEITAIQSGDVMQMSEWMLDYSTCEHDWQDTGTTIAPDCLYEGYTLQACAVCGTQRKIDIQQPLGHDFENGVCTRCGKPQINYLDENGVEQSAGYDAVITTTGTPLGETGKITWYAVTDDVIIDSRITVTGDVHLILADDCTLTVKGGIGVNKGNSLTIYAQSVPVLNTDGTLDEEHNTAGKLTVQNVANNNAGIGGDNGCSGGAITVSGGVINATGGINAAGIGGGQNGSGGTATVTGGAITISGGTVTANGGHYGAGIGGGYHGSGGAITISGGTVTANGGSYGAGIGGGFYGSGGAITISDGTVTATGGYNNAAAIGGGQDGSGGAITISGGTVTATGSILGAGIGGGYQGSGGAITISDGTVTATGGVQGAGIGGGGRGSGGAITISGGNVNAAITADGQYAYGAAIGSGANGSGGSVTITSGSVTAKVTAQNGGTAEGAAIGHGSQGENVSVSISGGEVNASVTVKDSESSASGAAIGGGNYKTTGNIVITGGTVNATVTADAGSTSGAAIGSGYNGQCGYVAITGGEVTATVSSTNGGTSNSAAIGGASYSTGSVTVIQLVPDVTAETDAYGADAIGSSYGSTGSVSGIRPVVDDARNVTHYEVYGSAQVAADLTIPNVTLLIPEDTTLDVSAVTATNNGKVFVDGTLIGELGGNVYYPLSVVNGTATAGENGIVWFLEKQYAALGKTITLTPTPPENQALSGWTVVPADAVTVDEANTFTMPTKALTLTASFADAVAAVTVDGVTTNYATIEKAFAAAAGHTAVVKLLQSVSVGSNRLTVGSGTDITLEMNEGVVLSGSGADILLVSGGSLTLNSGSIHSDEYTDCISVQSSGSLTINGGTLTTYGCCVSAATGTVTVTGGTLEKKIP